MHEDAVYVRCTRGRSAQAAHMRLTYTRGALEEAVRCRAHEEAGYMPCVRRCGEMRCAGGCGAHARCKRYLDHPLFGVDEVGHPDAGQDRELLLARFGSVELDLPDVASASWFAVEVGRQHDYTDA